MIGTHNSCGICHVGLCLNYLPPPVDVSGWRGRRLQTSTIAFIKWFRLDEARLTTKRTLIASGFGSFLHRLGRYYLALPVHSCRLSEYVPSRSAMISFGFTRTRDSTVIKLDHAEPLNVR